ncbi:hypothetical protein HA466_0222990 [Hirschfeldia incana]|nr:hypothetical protein HA466_0222990 [Hirschfeldia incana]
MSSPFVKSYLFAYNVLQASSCSVLSNNTINGGYAAAGYLISVMQMLLFLKFFMEPGIVSSGFLSPLIQWSGRTHFILAIVGQISEVQDPLWLAITLVACLVYRQGEFD